MINATLPTNPDPIADATESAPALAAHVSVHDAARLEWTVTIPFAQSPATRRYAVELELEIPTEVFAPHEPWKQLQSSSRLDGPIGDPGAAGADRACRILAVAVDRFTQASAGFARHLDDLLDCATPDSVPDSVAALEMWIEAARQTVVRARAAFERTRVDAVHAAHDQALADDYLGTQLMAFVTSTMTTLESARTSHALDHFVIADVLSPAHASLTRLLEDEIAYRTARGFLCPDRSHASLARMVDHASALKKHFRQPLHLQLDAFSVSERVHNLFSVFVAVIASTWAIVGQILLARNSVGASTQIGTGLVSLVIVAGVFYAIKDRIKEMGRAWLIRNLQRIYAQRVVRIRWSGPPRVAIASARESIEVTTRQVPDPLHPGEGHTFSRIVLRFVHRGRLAVVDHVGGARAMRHVFRYVLTPLLARLADPKTPIAVIDPKTNVAKIKQAPRPYRLPLLLRLSIGGERAIEQRAVLVVNKRGLRKIDRSDGDARG
jgi:hypothetical protein